MVAGAAVLALALVVGDRLAARATTISKDRYQASTAPGDFPDGMKSALAWFNQANPQDTRIGVVGGRPGFKQYVFYGDDLSNHVQYIARHGAHGAYLPIASEAAQNDREPDWRQQCEEWRRAVNDGDYHYLVIGPDQRTQSRLPIEAVWTARRPGRDARSRTATTISSSSIDGALDPAGCASFTGPGTGGGSIGGAAGATASVSFGEYLVGVLGLAAVAVPMALAAVRLRAGCCRAGRGRRPGWRRRCSASRCSRSSSSCSARSGSSCPPS